jgi:hypothetical protein
MALQVQGEGQLILTGHGPEAPPTVIGDIAHANVSQAVETGWVEVSPVRVSHDESLPRWEATSPGVLWADGRRITAP